VIGIVISSALILFLIAAVSEAAQTSADYTDSAKSLAGMCKDWETNHTSAIDAGYCLGYVSGVATAVNDCEGELTTIQRSWIKQRHQSFAMRCSRRFLVRSSANS
jgi:hypothetical protein